MRSRTTTTASARAQASIWLPSSGAARVVRDRRPARSKPARGAAPLDDSSRRRSRPAIMRRFRALLWPPPRSRAWRACRRRSPRPRRPGSTWRVRPESSGSSVVEPPRPLRRRGARARVCRWPWRRPPGVEHADARERGSQPRDGARRAARCVGTCCVASEARAGRRSASRRSRHPSPRSPCSKLPLRRVARCCSGCTATCSCARRSARPRRPAALILQPLRVSRLARRDVVRRSSAPWTAGPSTRASLVILR